MTFNTDKKKSANIIGKPLRNPTQPGMLTDFKLFIIVGLKLLYVTNTTFIESQQKVAHLWYHCIPTQ